MAALLAAAFFSLAILGRVTIQCIQTGNSGIRMANVKEQPLAAAAGSVFIISFALSVVVVVLDFAGTRPIPRIDVVWINQAAFVLGLLGVGVAVLAQLQMGTAWRIGVDPAERTSLVTNGLYRRSRNPIYFGIFIYWAALCVLLPHPSIWALAVICWLSIEIIVRKVEEPYLRERHGTVYEEYCASSRRYWL